MDKRLKVLVSAYACEPGKGSEPEVGWQWALQMARFHDVTVLTRANNRPAIEAELPDLREPKPQFVYHDLHPALLRLKNRFHATRAYYVAWQRSARNVVAALHRERHFDLLHHITFATFRYPTAVSGHGAPSVWGPIGGIESIPAALLPWRYPRPLVSEIVRNADNLVRASTVGTLRRQARRSNLVLVSTRQMQRALAGMGVTTRLMPAIGLDTAGFPIPARAVHDRPLRLLYVGNLLPLKGLDLALEALKASTTTAQLTLIGDGPFMANLDSLVTRLRLTGRVRFRGRLPRPEALASYKDHDLFLFPSLHDSGGYAVIEAMCNAIPVVCLATGGPETAVQANAGIAIPLGSRRNVIAGLAAAIQTYDSDRLRLVTDGRAARSVVEANYDWDAKGKLMDAFYREVVAPNRIPANKAIILKDV